MGRRVGRLVSSDLLREVSRERAVARLGREIIRHLGSPNPVAPLVIPALVATAVDGSADRLWHTARVTYLVQLAALAARAR